MSFEYFVKEVTATIKKYLPDEYQSASIDVRQQNKLNERYTGMTVRKGNEQAIPVFNLNMYYEQYCNTKMEMSNIMEDIADNIKNRDFYVNEGCLENYDLAKDNLFIRVSDVERNEYLLENMPYYQIENLAITYHIYMNSENRQIISAPITNQMLRNFGITKEQLHEDALKNSPCLFPAKMESMDDIIGKLIIRNLDISRMDEEVIDFITERVCDLDKVPLTMISNEPHIYGAAAIFYPGQLDEIGKYMKGNYFILPSSIHESATRFAA